MRVALGAFRASPIPSLYAVAGDPSLKFRRLKLCMNYYLKIKSLPESPCYDPVNNPPPSKLFEKSKTDPPFGIRILPHFLQADIDPTSIDNQHERTPPPWEHNYIIRTYKR